VLASLIAAFASGETVLALRRARNATIAYGLAAICGLFGLIFLLIAAYVAAAHRYGPIHAALFAAGIFLVIALLIVLIHKLSSRTRAIRHAQRRKSDVTKIALAASLAIVPTLLAGRAGKAVLIAPALAALAYLIYRENTKPGDTDED